MSYFDEETIDFINDLLEKDPQKRLGSNGTIEIRNHPFFDDIDWEELEARNITPEF
jgi:serine/threonine protein kinase